MAARAISGYARMVETTGVPVRRRVTLSAVVRRRRMVRRFACRGAPIVACRAGPRHSPVIEPRVGPLLGCVACFAVVRAGHVAGLFTRRDHTVVAGGASLRGSLEDALDMATAAGDVFVTFAKRKSRLQMHRSLVGIRCRRRTNEEGTSHRNR